MIIILKDEFVQKVNAFVAKHEMLCAGAKVVVAVSGGADSLALLYYLMERKEREDLFIVVAHVDHMFRGEESWQDLLYVRGICEQLQVPFESARIPVASYQKEHHLGAQTAARECRYRFLEEVMNKYKANALALGHHGDDQVETILMRLVRGSSMKGYAGMSLKRAFSNGVIIRPFLAVTKQEIEQYCYNKGIVPRVDPSNNKDTYTRNRFRKYVLPRLKEENPVVHEKFQAFSKFIQEDEDYLQELAIQKMNKVIRKENETQVVLSIPDFESLPMPLQRRGIQLILNYLYNSKLPSSLSSIHIEQVLSFLKRSHPSGSLDFPEGLKVTRTYEECSFGFLEEKAAPFSYAMSVPGTVILPNGDELTAEISKEIPSLNDGTVFVVPKGIISPPLVVRSRMNGDRMHIRGMNGSKKIKAIFIEEKVPKHKREEWPIVCDAKGTILWLPLLKQASVNLEEAAEEASYIIIRYKSKESSRRINR